MAVYIQIRKGFTNKCTDLHKGTCYLSHFEFHYKIWGFMQIRYIHLTQCYHIFLRLSTWDLCYIILCNLLHVHSGKTGILFSLLLRGLWRVQIVGYVLACRSYTFVSKLNHVIIIIVQTYLKTKNLKNACQIYFVACVRLSIFSQLPMKQYMGLCVFSLPISLVLIEIVFTLSYYHHQIGSMNYYPLFGLGHETMVCAVCLSIFLQCISKFWCVICCLCLYMFRCVLKYFYM